MSFACVLALAALMTGAGAARAHAVLLEASPADGALMPMPPREILLRFNEDVTPVFVRVLDGAGRAVAAPAPAQARDETVRLALPRGLANGSYVVSYRVISADTHPVGASLVFAVGPPGTAVGAIDVPNRQEGMWSALAVGDRALLDIALLLAVGGGLFTVLVAEPVSRHPRAAVIVPAAIAVAASVLALGIEGGLALEAPLASFADAATWRTGLATGLGPSIAVTLAGLALVAFAPSRLVILLGAALAAAGYAVAGHVAMAEPRWLTAPALWLHVLCVAFWAGSLVPLWRMLRGRGAAPSVERFSRDAVMAVGLIALAGTAMAGVQLSRLADFRDTEYGERLAFKLALVAALLAVASVNRLVLTPALRRGQPRAALWLRRSIAVELGLMAAIVVAAASLGAATPPRALAEQQRAHDRLAASGALAGVFVDVADRGLSAFIALEPARPGLNRLRLDLADDHEAPLAAKEMTLWIANEALGIEPSRHAMHIAGPGIYEISDLAIPVSGTWTFRLAALVGDFDERVLTTEVSIP
ncbi:MAG TPA: CopD family protein [Stellaceae bacterium]|nr:CopD family protein [Stellaceae bacterium]